MTAIGKGKATARTARLEAVARRRRLSVELIEKAFAGYHREVQQLLEAGAELEAQDHNGYTALSEACVAGQTVVVGVLLRSLADPNSVAKDGRTPLHRAAVSGWLPIVRLLLDRGADPALKDATERTPAELIRAGSPIHELLVGCPAERTQEFLAKWRKDLAEKRASAPQSDLEEVEGEEELEEEENDDLKAAAAATPGGEPPFSPPPRDGRSAEGVDSNTTALKPVPKKESKKAQRERRYQEALEELKAAGADPETGEIPQLPPPLTARVEVTRAGEERLNGVYCAHFVAQGQVEFEKIGDEMCRIVWADWSNEWRMMIGDYKLGSTLHRHSRPPNIKADPCYGVPKDGWVKWFGKDPVPTVRHMAEDEPDPDDVALSALSSVEAGSAPDPSLAPANGTDAGKPHPQARAEFIELHPRLEIVSPAEGATRGTPAPSAQGTVVDISLGGGRRIVETSDGLFDRGELGNDDAEAAPVVSPEDTAATAWLENLDGAPIVPGTWEDVQAAKAAAQELFAEGKVKDARLATTAALQAGQELSRKCRIEPSIATGDENVGGHVQTEAEVNSLIGILHSNRSLLLLQLIQSGDAEVLQFGPEAAWRLVAVDADAALLQDPCNFKASFRRAQALLELGEVEDALKDATRVVDHYARHSTTPNPEAVAFRDRAVEALRKERNKWGQKAPVRWNRASTDMPLVAELGDSRASVEPTGRASVEQTDAPITSSTSSTALRARTKRGAANEYKIRSVGNGLRASASSAPSAPRVASDVERALLVTLRGNEVAQLAYVKEHLPASGISRLFRRVAIGPDLLVALFRILAALAVDDALQAGERFLALAAAPSARMHVAMLNGEEQAVLRLVVDRVGTPEAAKAFQEAADDTA